MRPIRTIRMGGIALKMGVLFERSEFRPFSNDRHSQGNGSSGRPPFAMPKRFTRNQRFRFSAYLGSFFFGGTKKNEHTRAAGNNPCFLTAQKEKVFSICKRQFTRKKCRNSFLQKKERPLPMASVLFCQDLFVFDNTPEYCYNRYGNNSRHNGFRNPVGNTNSHNNIHYMI